MHNQNRLAACAALAAFSTVAGAASAQNACIAAGVDPACCAIVCATSPNCCDAAWDASCTALLAAANCACQGAVTVSLGTVAVDTRGLTRDLDLAGLCDPGPFGDDILHNYAVFAWTPPAPGRYTLSTCNQAAFDTRLAVLGGCNSGSVIGCNDDGDGCDAFTSVLSVEIAAVTTHYIVLGGYSEADVGLGTLTIDTFQVQLALDGMHRYESSAGGTGRWYAKFAVGAGATWSDLAEKASSMGATLACANTPGENRLMGSLAQAAGLDGTIAFGLVQDPLLPGVTEPAGGWRWIDGSALAFASWAGGEPSNSKGVEHFGRFTSLPTGEFWNDEGDAGPWSHAIFEFGASGPPFAPPVPANDEPGGAIALELGQLNIVSLVGASTSAGFSSCQSQIYYDRWYTITPQASDSYDIVGCGNGFTAAVAVYAPSGALVACSAGECTLTTALTGGLTYRVRVGSVEGDRAGNPTLVIYPTPFVVSLDAISVNFVGGNTLNGADGGRCVETATFPAGVADWGTLRWTNIVGASTASSIDFAKSGNGDMPTGLQDGRGAPTTASVQFSVANTRRIFSYPADDTERMRRGYLDSNGSASITVAVTGVPYSRYSAIVYFGAEAPDRPGSVAVNGGAPIHFKTDAVPEGFFNPLVRATATSASAAVRSSYAVFEGLSGATCSIVLAENGPNLGLMGFQIVAEPAACPADLNGDGVVSAPDLTTLLSAWGAAGGDTNGDGTTNAQDITTLLSAWGDCP